MMTEIEALDLETFKAEAARLFAIRRMKWRNEPRDGIVRLLEHWVMLGAGYYGEAWTHLKFPHLVVKISGREGWGYDNTGAWHNRKYGKSCSDIKDAWAAFAYLCTTEQYAGIPELPKILHIEKATEGMTWAVMRRYEPASHGPSWDWDMMEALVSNSRGWISMMEEDVRALTGLNLSRDIHSDNIMWCNITKKYIITDPFSTVPNQNYRGE